MYLGVAVYDWSGFFGGADEVRCDRRFGIARDHGLR